MTSKTHTAPVTNSTRRDSVISLALSWIGRVMPRDVAASFDVSEAQATRILASWAIAHPGKSEHRKNAQGHFASGERTHPMSSVQVLGFLRGQALSEWAGRGLGMHLGIPMTDISGQLEPPVPDSVLRPILSAIATREAVSIHYVGRSRISERIVSPTLLAHALGRCHVRGFDHGEEVYRDFVLARISDAEQIKRPSPLPSDKESADRVVLTFRLNPDASEHAKAVASTEWRLETSDTRSVTVSKAMAIYVVRHSTRKSSNGVSTWICADAKTSAYEKEVAS